MKKEHIIITKILLGFPMGRYTKCGIKIETSTLNFKVQNKCKKCFELPIDDESNKIPIEMNSTKNIIELKKINLKCPGGEHNLIPSNDLGCPDKYYCITKSCKISWIRIKMR